LINVKIANQTEDARGRGARLACRAIPPRHKCRGLSRRTMNILVTGASGFVGSALCLSLSNSGQHRVVAALRKASDKLPGTVEQFEHDDLSGPVDWTQALAGIDVVVHCAARTHVMRDTSEDPLSLYRKINRDATIDLAKQAAASGVKRFVFLSSIKVNGEFTLPGKPLQASDPPDTRDPYGISKAEAEKGLLDISRSTGLEVVIIRPPLVYGPGVKANLASLVSAISRGIPLPLGAIKSNRRSMVALDNLVSLITTCLDHPAAANQIFLVSDGEDLSTTDLVLRIGFALGRQPRLIPVPCPLLQLLCRCLGRPAIAQRLCGSLQVDIGHTETVLGWKPVITVDTGIAKMIKEADQHQDHDKH